MKKRVILAVLAAVLSLGMTACSAMLAPEKPAVEEDFVPIHRSLSTESDTETTAAETVSTSESEADEAETNESSAETAVTEDTDTEKTEAAEEASEEAVESAAEENTDITAESINAKASVYVGTSGPTEYCALALNQSEDKAVLIMVDILNRGSTVMAKGAFVDNGNSVQIGSNTYSITKTDGGYVYSEGGKQITLSPHEITQTELDTFKSLSGIDLQTFE